jgi:hypothetical protein
MRGEAHPQQWIVDALEEQLALLKGPASRDHVPITVFRFDCTFENRFEGVEGNRLRTVEERDGVEGAREFAAQTSKLYKEHVKKRSGFCGTATKRREFVASYVSFKRYVKGTLP